MKRFSAHFVYTHHKNPLRRGVVGITLNNRIAEIHDMSNRYIELPSTIFFNGVIVPYFIAFYERNDFQHSNFSFIHTFPIDMLGKHKLLVSDKSGFHCIELDGVKYYLLNANFHRLDTLIAASAQFNNFDDFLFHTTTLPSQLLEKEDLGKINIGNKADLLLVENFDFENNTLTPHSVFKILSGSTFK